MTADDLRALQSPLKARYRDDPTAARLTLTARAELNAPDIACRIPTHTGQVVEAGLHPAAGGDGSQACAGTMLLEALAACAGVTLKAVGTALNLPVQDARISVEGDLDMRGTLGVDRATPVGFSAIRLAFELPSIPDQAPRQKLIELTERYCVVYQTLKRPPRL
jgi:uncharacterized OsmC-like protein